jgi:hypothetical protein
MVMIANVCRHTGVIMQQTVSRRATLLHSHHPGYVFVPTVSLREPSVYRGYHDVLQIGTTCSMS